MTEMSFFAILDFPSASGRFGDRDCDCYFRFVRSRCSRRGIGFGLRKAMRVGREERRRGLHQSHQKSEEDEDRSHTDGHQAESLEQHVFSPSPKGLVCL